jgi:hypothetical protein
VTTPAEGPALPTLDEVSKAHPRWYCFEGVAGLVYASRVRRSPPLVVSAPTPMDLLDEIRKAQENLP